MLECAHHLCIPLTRTTTFPETALVVYRLMWGAAVFSDSCLHNQRGGSITERSFARAELLPVVTLKSQCSPA